MRIRHILLIAAAAGLFLSCVKEPEQPNGGPGDGTATRITLSLTSDKQAGALPQAASKDALQAWNASGGLGTAGLGAIPGTRALTPEQEQSISNLHILIFDALGALVTNEHFDNLDIKDAGSVSLETLPGEKMQLWAVANGDVNDDTGDTPLDTELRAITTLDELKALLVTVKGNGLNRADRLTMVGCETVTITKPHVGSIPIQLHFLSAKVTVSIKSNVPEGQAITIDNWDMVNIPKKTYLMERANPSEDAVTGKSDYITTNAKYQFDPQDEQTKTWSQAFYLFENRRGGRVERSDPSGDMYPDMGFGDQDQRGKAYYAPTYATYMLVYGTYTKDGRMNNVIYKIFLGENEINDYNIYRGKHYTYNVTINGLNDINIDTNVEWGSASFSVATSQDFQLDAHPDFRVLRIGGTAVDGTTPAYAAVEVQEANGSPCEWLALSPLNLYRHGIKQAGATGGNQQFAVGDGEGSYVRSKYTPTPTSESTFADVPFGMTRKLTKIPFDQPAIYTFQNVLVYANAYEGTADRSAKVHVTYYKGAEGTDPVGELTYDITQSGAIKVSDSLYIERYEESAMLLHPGLASGFQNTTTMQWGYNTATLYAADNRFTNGNYLTANAVYNNVNARDGMTPPIWPATTYTDYREKYPREGTQVVEPSPLPVSDPVYFYPEQTQATALTAYFHPIFNSSAARYCHEKNRDTDGDGVISADETVWYLPSFADMWYISKNMPEGVNLTGTYWTASEENNTNSWTYSFPAAPASTIKSTSARVRCVMGMGAVLPEATMESTEDDKTKINLLATAGASGAFNITDVTGLTWTVKSSDATWLKVALAADGTSALTSASGTGEKTLYAYAETANQSITTPRSATICISRMGLAAPADTIYVTQERTIAPATVTPTALTLNYDAGAFAKFYIDNEEAGLEWTVTVSDEAQSWLYIATDENGAGAAKTRSDHENADLFAYSATKNDNERDARNGSITFSRMGQKNIVINVVQSSQNTYPTATQGWAGSNIYWDKYYSNGDGTTGRLTFSDVNDERQQLYQGVFFKIGSLVPIMPSKNFDNTSCIFSPTGTKYTTYSSIPYPERKYYWPLDHAYLYDIHDPSKDIGDICKYLTEKGWAPGSQAGKKWRLPLEVDFAEDSIAVKQNTPPSDWQGSSWEGKSNTGFNIQIILKNKTAIRMPFSNYMNDAGKPGEKTYTWPGHETLGSCCVYMTNSGAGDRETMTVAWGYERGEHTFTTRYLASGSEYAAYPVRCVLE